MAWSSAPHQDKATMFFAAHMTIYTNLSGGVGAKSCSPLTRLLARQPFAPSLLQRTPKTIYIHSVDTDGGSSFLVPALLARQTLCMPPSANRHISRTPRNTCLLLTPSAHRAQQQQCLISFCWPFQTSCNLHILHVPGSFLVESFRSLPSSSS